LFANLDWLPTTGRINLFYFICNFGLNADAGRSGEKHKRQKLFLYYPLPFSIFVLSHCWPYYYFLLFILFTYSYSLVKSLFYPNENLVQIAGRQQIMVQSSVCGAFWF